MSTALKCLTLSLTLLSQVALASGRAPTKVRLSEYAADGMTDNLNTPTQRQALLKAFAPEYPTTRIPVGKGASFAEVHDYVIDYARSSIGDAFKPKGIAAASVRLSDSGKNLIFTTPAGKVFNAEVGYNNRGGPTIVSVEKL